MSMTIASSPLERGPKTAAELGVGHMGRNQTVSHQDPQGWKGV